MAIVFVLRRSTPNLVEYLVESDAVGTSGILPNSGGVTPDLTTDYIAQFQPAAVPGVIRPTGINGRFLQILQTTPCDDTLASILLGLNAEIEVSLGSFNGGETVGWWFPRASPGARPSIEVGYEVGSVGFFRQLLRIRYLFSPGW